MSVLDERLTPRSLAGIPVVAAGAQKARFNGLVYGEFGSGKTRFAGSSVMVPSMRDVLVIDIEAGTLTLRNTYPDCKTIHVTTWEKMQEVYDELHAGNHNYGTVIIDSLTEAQWLNMDKVMRELISEHPDRDHDIAGLQEWQKNQTQIKKYIRAFRDLPLTTITTALMKEDKNKQNGKVTKRPDLPGKLAAQVPALYDEVFFLYVLDIEGVPMRHLLTGSTENIVAKDRSGRLPLVMQNPTMTDVYEKMFGEISE